LGTHPITVIPDEDAMLQQLDGGSLTGLIITGKGGFGKTRLTLELSKLAVSKGWVLLRGQINQILSLLSEALGFMSGDLRRRSDVLLAEWVRNIAAFDDREIPKHFQLQSDYFQRVVELLKSGLLTLSQNRSHLLRFFRWVNRWQPEIKEELEWVIELYRDDYPDPELWDIIEFLPKPGSS
jgi:hypothetical protein